MDKKALGELIDQAYRRLGNKATVILADRLRTLGYQHATRAGISICIDDMQIPSDKERFIEKPRTEQVAGDRGAVPGRSDHRRRALQQGDRHLGEGTEQVSGQMLERLGTESSKSDDDGEEHARSELQPHLHDGRLRAPAVRPSRCVSWPGCAA